MKRFLKISAAVVALLVAVMVVVPMTLVGKVDAIVKREANAMLNAVVEFEELEISLFSHFPKASIALTELSVTGVDKFDGQTLVAARRAEVAVDLLSIFGESFEVSNVWLLDAEVNGVVAADGAVNWDIMKSSEEDIVELEEEPEEAEESAFRLSLRSLSCQNAKVSYVDRESNIEFRTAPLSFTMSGDMSASTTTIQIDGSAANLTFVSDGNSYASSLTATLRGAVAADFERERYTLSDLTLTANSVKAALDGWVEFDGDDIVTDITLDCSDNDFKSILSLVPALYTKDFEELTATGDVSLTGAVKGRMSGDKYPAFELRLSVADGTFKYADLPKSVTGIAVVAAVENSGGVLDNTKVDISKFTASIAGQSVEASLKAATPIADLAFDVAVKGVVDLGAVKDIYPLEDMALAGVVTADATVRGKMSDIDKGAYDRLAVNGKLGVEDIEVEYGKFPTIEVNRALATLSPTKMALEQLDVKIGKSDISAAGSLTNYWGYILHNKTLSGRLALKSTLLDLNELMAAMSDEEQQPEQPAEKSEETAEAVTAIEVPKNLELVLDCKMDKVLLEKMEIENFAGRASVSGGVLSLDNLVMNMFDGKASATASYSTVDADNPRLGLDAKFAQASFKKTAAQLEIVEKIVPLFEKIEGNYTMNLKCNMLLDREMSPVLNSVDGSGSITSGNFKLSNVPALERLAKVVGRGVDLSTIAASENTVISFTIENGNVVTKPFDIRLGSTTLTLSGLTGLDQRIDYSVAVALPQMTLYGTIGGTFTDPKVALDAEKSVESALSSVGVTKEVVEQKVDDTKQKLRAEAEAKAAAVVEAARKEADRLVEKATNPIAKVAAKAAASKLIEEAERQAAKILEGTE